MESAHPKCETCTRTWSIGFTAKVLAKDMAVQSPCMLVLSSNRWADFLSNLVLPFSLHLQSYLILPAIVTNSFAENYLL